MNAFHDATSVFHVLTVDEKGDVSSLCEPRRVFVFPVGAARAHPVVLVTCCCHTDGAADSADLLTRAATGEGHA